MGKTLNLLNSILIYLLVINSITFFTFGYDKWLSGLNKRRVPERNLFILVLATSISVAGGYIINNFYDSKKDIINRPRKSMIDRLVRQATKLKVYFAINFWATGISASGASVKETRMVSPRPSSKSAPIPTADLMRPSSPSPASVTPKCKG